MKRLIPIFAIYTLFGSAHAKENLPYKLQNLIDQRAKAVEKIDLTYVKELQKLKERYTKQGNLEIANTIVALIEARGGGSNDRPIKQDPIVGVYRWPSDKYVAFLPDGMLYVFEGRKWNCGWKFNKLGSKYKFTWSDESKTEGVMEDGVINMKSGPFRGEKISRVR